MRFMFIKVFAILAPLTIGIIVLIEALESPGYNFSSIAAGWLIGDALAKLAYEIYEKNR